MAGTKWYAFELDIYGLFLIQPAKCGIIRKLDLSRADRMPIVKIKCCPCIVMLRSIDGFTDAELRKSMSEDLTLKGSNDRKQG